MLDVFFQGLDVLTLLLPDVFFPNIEVFFLLLDVFFLLFQVLFGASFLLFQVPFGVVFLLFLLYPLIELVVVLSTRTISIEGTKC